MRLFPKTLVATLVLSSVVLSTSIYYEWELISGDGTGILELETAVGYRRYTNGFMWPWTQEMGQELLKAVESPQPGVQVTSLWITIQALKQLEISNEFVDEQIEPIARRFIESPPELPPSHRQYKRFERFVADFPLRILWYVELLRIDTDHDRVAFLGRTLGRDGPDRAWYTLETVAQLVLIGDEESKRVLTSKSRC